MANLKPGVYRRSGKETTAQRDLRLNMRSMATAMAVESDRKQAQARRDVGYLRIHRV